MSYSLRLFVLLALNMPHKAAKQYDHHRVTGVCEQPVEMFLLLILILILSLVSSEEFSALPV